MKNNSDKSVEFFTDAANGLHQPHTVPSCRESIIDRVPYLETIEHYHERYRGRFDDHIIASIPLFLESSLLTIRAIRAMSIGKSLRVLDIGSSNGTWGKTLSFVAGSGVSEVIAIDPNPDMETSTGSMINFKHVKASFLHECCGVPPYKAEEKFDVVRESMVFQFISKIRSSFISEVASMLKDDGLFITEEKFKERLKTDNEAIKNNFKALHFNTEQLNSKDKDVLVTMAENQCDYSFYIRLLERKFKYVKLYWHAGNFAGVACSNSKEAIDNFMKNMNKGLVDNEFNSDNRTTVVADSIPNTLSSMTTGYPRNKCNRKNVHMYITNADKDCVAAIGTPNENNNVELCCLAKNSASLQSSWAEKAMSIRLDLCKHLGFNPWLSCFDIPKLIDLNKKHGFIEYKREKFNEDLAPDGWREDATLSGKPDIIFMKLKE